MYTHTHTHLHWLSTNTLLCLPSVFDMWIHALSMNASQNIGAYTTLMLLTVVEKYVTLTLKPALVNVFGHFGNILSPCKVITVYMLANQHSFGVFLVT